jgi:hypothetical protein
MDEESEMSEMEITQARKSVRTPLPIIGILQRKCDKCRKKPLLQRAAAGPYPETVPPIVHEVLRSPGAPLDAVTRAFMEPRFGNDFSRVRVHTDAKASESARAVNALAYTVGQDVVFGKWQHVPGTYEGQHLLAHELAHVAQQNGAMDSIVQRAPAPERIEPTSASRPIMPAGEPSRLEGWLKDLVAEWKWKDLAAYPLLVDIWNDLIKKELTAKELEEMKLTGNEASACYNWIFAIGLAGSGLGGAKAEGKEASKDLETISNYAEALQGVTPGSDSIMDCLSRLLGLRFDKYLESDRFMARLKAHPASVTALFAIAQGIVSTVAAAKELSEGKGEMTEEQWSKQLVLVRWLVNKLLKEQLKAPDFFDVGPLQLKTHPAFSATPFAGGSVPSGLTFEGKTGVEEGGKERKLGLTLNLTRLIGNKEALDLSKYRRWQTSFWLNYELKDPAETMKLANKLPESQLKGGTIFGGSGHLGLLEAGARYGGKESEQLTSWFVRGGYGFAGVEGSTLKKIGFSATYVDWNESDLLAPGRETGRPTAGRAVQVSPFTSLHFGGKGMHQFDAGAALSIVSGSEETLGVSGFRTDLSYTYLGAQGTDKLPVFKLDLSGSLNRLDWHNPNSPLMWGVLAKGTAGRYFGGAQVMSGAGSIPEQREQLFGESLKTKVPTAVIFSAGYNF